MPSYANDVLLQQTQKELAVLRRQIQVLQELVDAQREALEIIKRKHRQLKDLHPACLR